MKFKSYILFILISTIYLYGSVGYISAIKGEILVNRNGSKSKAFKGLELEKGDTIFSLKQSKAQIIFKDKTVIKIGQKTTFKINDYLFDETKNSTAQFKIRHGFFSVVTGKIGKVARKNFKLKTKTFAIGIRGTHFQGFVSDTKENIVCLKGAILLYFKDKIIELASGEIISIVDGILNAPKKFEELDLDKIDQEALEFFQLPNMENIRTKFVPSFNSPFNYF
jgi:hypothetical protein